MPDFIEFFSKQCNSKYVYWYLLILYIVSNCFFIQQYNLYSKKSWCIFLGILAIHIILMLLLISIRKFPKFKKNEIGIIFAIDTETEEQNNLINQKFTKEFSRSLKETNNFYNVKMFNFYLTKRFNEKYDSNEKILSFMKKRRAKFIIFGHSVFGNESETIACKLHLKNGIVHGKLSEQNYKLFAHESHNVFDPLKDIEILKQTETDDFELNAIQLNYAYEYLTACICLLTYRIDDAFFHFQNIKKRIKNTTKNAPVINYIKNSIDHRLCICSLLLSQKALNKYYEKPEKHLLSVMKQHLDDIEKLNPNIYQFRLFSSIYYFLYSRDIDRALLCLANCNNVKYDSIWKFNKIFLKLYQKDTISNFLNAYNTYTSAFKSKISFTELNNIAEFITRTLDEEPDKKQLCFLLMLIYNHLNDQILFRKYFYEFTKTYHHILENENIQRIFLKIAPNISTIEQTLGTTSSELYA